MSVVVVAVVVVAVVEVVKMFPGTQFFESSIGSNHLQGGVVVFYLDLIF